MSGDIRPHKFINPDVKKRKKVQSSDDEYQPSDDEQSNPNNSK